MSLANVRKYVELRMDYLKTIRGPTAREAQKMARELEGVMTEIERYHKKSPEQIKGEEAKFLREQRVKAKHADEKAKKMDEIRARKAEREMADEKGKLADEKEDETATEKEPHDAPPG